MIAAAACSDGIGPDGGGARCEGIRFGVTEQSADSRAGGVEAPREFMLSSDADTCRVAVGVTVTDMCDSELSSRAAPVAGGDIKAFTVYSFFYPSAAAEPRPFFAGEQATREGSLWTTTTLYYWPDSPDTTLAFWAMVGHDAAGVNVSASTTGTDAMAVDYTVPQNATEQADLMIATTGRLNTPGASVPLRFRHICSAVRFVFGTEMQPGTIKEITLSGIKSGGRYTTGWSDITGETSFTINTSKVTTGNENAGDPIQSDSYTLMMIPQQLADDAMLTVVFDDKKTGNTRTLTASLAGGEWKEGKVTTYRIGITREYKLEFIEQVDRQDAHYVICNSSMRISDVPDGKAWTLTARASDGADVSVQLTADINEYAATGFWTDKYITNGATITSESARGTNTVKGSGSGDFPLTVFLPENVSDADRTITLTLNVDGLPADYAVTQEITQVSPLWNGSTGWEQIDDHINGMYGFVYSSCYVYVYNYSSFKPNELNAVKNMIVDLISQYNASEYVSYDQYYQFPGGYRYYVAIDFRKLNDLGGNAKSSKDGLNNTRELFRFGGSGVSDTFEDALGTLKKVQDNSKAFEARRPTDPSSVPPWINGNEINESQVLTLVLKKNRYYLNKYTDKDTGTATTAPLIREEDIKWYLPAYEQFNGMPAEYSVPADYWSSTSYNDAEHSYAGNGALQQRTAQLKIRVARNRE